MTRAQRRTIGALLVAAVAVLALVGAYLVLAPTARAAEPPTPPSVVAIHTDPDQTGIHQSAYTGRYYRPVDEAYRRCIAQREGRGQYWITGRNGYYQGTYQMTPALVRGAAWEMTPELRALWPDRWRTIRNALLDTPGHRWGRYWQDMAFWTILNVDGAREGAAHWSGGRFTCTPGMTTLVGNR
jgi:hypothetical protein